MFVVRAVDQARRDVFHDEGLLAQLLEQGPDGFALLCILRATEIVLRHVNLCIYFTLLIYAFTHHYYHSIHEELSRINVLRAANASDSHSKCIFKLILISMRYYYSMHEDIRKVTQCENVFRFIYA